MLNHLLLCTITSLVFRYSGFISIIFAAVVCIYVVLLQLHAPVHGPVLNSISYLFATTINHLITTFW